LAYLSGSSDELIQKGAREMWIGFVMFFLFFFARGFVQQRKRQHIDRLQQEVNQMRKQMAQRQGNAPPER
jgi:ABC-type transport system involved in cytochrome bd biosynthesis fused ATPase/permease subunit